MGTLPGVSMRRVCRVLGFSRARLRARAALAAVPPRLDAALAERIQQLIEQNPTFGKRVSILSITHKLRHGKSQFDISESG